MLLRGLLVLASAAVASIPSIPPADAHSPFNPSIRVEIDGISPATPDVRIVGNFDVQGLPPRMTARNDGASPLEILAVGGEPLFRITGDGSFGNVRSAAYRAAVDPFGVLPPPSPQPGTAPDWRKLASEPVLRWYEDRADFHARVPAAIASTAGPAELARWRIPARIGGRAAAIEGRIVWKVPRGRIRARALPARWTSKVLTVTALDGPIPGIQVRNSSRQVLEVTGRDGAPFARVSAAGVDVNTRSATWADTKGIPEPGGDGPEWRHETNLPVLIWVESRAAYDRPEPPEGVERAGKHAVLVRWRIPARLGDDPIEIAGETYWAPLGTAAKGSGTPALALAAVVVAALAAVALLRRRGTPARR